MKKTVAVRIPYRYTAAAKRKEVVIKPLYSIDPSAKIDFPAIDFADIEARVVAAFEPKLKSLNRFYTTMAPSEIPDPALDCMSGPGRGGASTGAASEPGKPKYTFTAAKVNAPKEERKLVRSHASYLSPLIESPDEVIARFRAKMRAVDFDTLVGTGLSGSLAVPMLARSVGCHFALVRKANDASHSDNSVEGNVGKRWVFVDDLICSGETRRRVRGAMADFCAKHNFMNAYVGDYMYHGNHFNAAEANGNV
jgi:hypothetical protein